MKYHILHDSRASTTFNEKFGHFKNFDVDLTLSPSYEFITPPKNEVRLTKKIVSL